MVETEVASLIAPWLTPTSLFVLLNIVLATIFFANNKHHSKNNDEEHNNNDNDSYHQYDYQNQHRGEYEGASLVPPPPQLARAPSLFSRVASFNFSNFYSESHAPSSEAADQNVTVARAPSLLYRVTSFNFSRAPQKADGEKKNEEEARDVSVSHVRRENQEQQRREEEEVVEVKEKVVKVKKKGGNKKVNKEVTEVSGGSSMGSVAKETETPRRVDEGVDSKADDFIHKFKQQLKLQRLESLLRYRSNTPAAT